MFGREPAAQGEQAASASNSGPNEEASTSGQTHPDHFKRKPVVVIVIGMAGAAMSLEHGVSCILWKSVTVSMHSLCC